MVYFLMRTMDFMAFVMRLVAEDFVWLKDYLHTLTSWHCVGFFALCLLYILIMRFINHFLVFIINRLLSRFGIISSETLEKFTFKLRASNLKYSLGYNAGYNAGCEYSSGYNEGKKAGRNSKKASWWNPFSWSNWFN